MPKYCLICGLFFKPILITGEKPARKLCQQELLLYRKEADLHSRIVVCKICEKKCLFENVILLKTQKEGHCLDCGGFEQPLKSNPQFFLFQKVTFISGCPEHILLE